MLQPYCELEKDKLNYKFFTSDIITDFCQLKTDSIANFIQSERDKYIIDKFSKNGKLPVFQRTYNKFL